MVFCAEKTCFPHAPFWYETKIKRIPTSMDARTLTIKIRCKVKAKGRNNKMFCVNFYKKMHFHGKKLLSCLLFIVTLHVNYYL